MGYDEAMQAEVTREEARAEISRHFQGCEASYLEEAWADFLAQEGDCDTYEGSQVLSFLGY